MVLGPGSSWSDVVFHITFLQGVNRDVTVVERASLSSCFKKTFSVREAEQRRAACAGWRQRKDFGIWSQGVQGSVWGPEGKGRGTESGYPGCGVLPWEQRFGVGGKTPQRMKAASGRVGVCGAPWLCLRAVRGVTAGNIGEPL